MNAGVVVRDRRALPFFMVRVRALQEIRQHISGPRRARALGLHTLLCQMTNEQRDVGEQRRVTATYRQLTERGGLSSQTLNKLLVALDAARAVRPERRVDAFHGSLPTLFHLPTQDDPWVGVTVIMAQRLAAQTKIKLLPALGLLVVLLEFCDEQREEHGGQLAETTRAKVAARVGCAVDTLDTWANALQAAGVLTITRRRETGGPNLPNLWEITEAGKDPAIADVDDQAAQGRQEDKAPAAPAQHPDGGRTTPPRRDDNTPAAEEQHPPGAGTTPGPHADNTPAAAGQCQGGDSATPVGLAPPINERGRDQTEGLAAENGFPPTPGSADGGPEKGEGFRTVLELCAKRSSRSSRKRGARRRDAATTPTPTCGMPLPRGSSSTTRRTRCSTRSRTWSPIRSSGRRCAACLTSSATSRISATAPTPPAAAHRPRRRSPGGAPTWADAHSQIRLAIRRHGAGGRAAARTELFEQHPAYGRFVDAVGWDALCHASASQADYEWKQAWKHACDAPPQAEAA